NNVERIHISTAEEYSNELFEALIKKEISRSRETNRAYKALLIDDVQFISGKTSLAAEFSFNVDSVLCNGGKVLLTADRGPEEIQTDKRFRNRLASGVTAGVELPGKAALNAVGQSVAERLGVVVSSDHIASLAEKYSNPWLLTGAIKSASVLETIEKGDL
ncbi:MAG: hypothetical protein IK047_05675, partial [Clostridia bacterium]|nr:hypothetical protein [Clostridia bacterium]